MMSHVDDDDSVDAKGRHDNSWLMVRSINRKQHTATRNVGESRCMSMKKCHACHMRKNNVSIMEVEICLEICIGDGYVL